jgi:cell cycle checkpoint protein
MRYVVSTYLLSDGCPYHATFILTKSVQPENPEEIPFQRNAMQLKIIMQSRWLYDAVSELSSTSPTRLDITASPDAPYLRLSAVGPLGSASVDFAKGRELLETFTVAEKRTQSYKFEMVRAASEAMRLSSKGTY